MMSAAARNDKGEWVIPATRRPDGTWRKEKVIKEGYVPQEEIKAFETRATKPPAKSIPGMPPPSSVHSKDKGGSSKKISSPRLTSSSSSSNPSQKSLKSDLKDEKIPPEESIPDMSHLHINENKNSNSKESILVSTAQKDNLHSADASEQSIDNKEKKLKSLRKKMRDIDELLQKDPKSLSEEQIQKINRKAEIMDQINLLSSS